MSVHLTTEDRNILTQAVAAFGGNYHHLAVSTPAPVRELLSLRYLLGLMSQRGPHRYVRLPPTYYVPTTAVKAQLLLAKLRYYRGNPDGEYCVTMSREPFTFAPIRDLYKAWRRRIDYAGGADPWVLRDRETVVWGMHVLFEMNIPAVMPMAAYPELVAAIAELEREVQQIKSPNDSESSDDESVFLRPEFKVGTGGNSKITHCYTCGLAKPPQVPCKVCGRIPRTR